MARQTEQRRGARSEAAPYQEFLDRLHRRLRAAPKASREAPLSIASELPGVFELVASLAAGAIVEVDAHKRAKVREWNAFSQRVFLLTADELQDEALTRDLDRAADAVDRFIDLCHQASHLLLLEPFFVGRWGVPTEAEFVETSLVFEGFCFWIADILVTRRLRVRLSDGEIVRTRSSFSQSRFHPYRAFEALGVKDDDRILDVYLRAFAGEKTALFRKRHVPFVSDLFERFAKFWAGSQIAVPELRRELAAGEVFGAFRTRFCCVPGLPTILPEELLRIDGNVEARAFCLAVARKGLPELGRLPEETLQRVRERRALQTRAYSAYCLRAVLRNDEVMTKAGKKGRFAKRTAVLGHLETYLDGLEAAIHALADGAPLARVRALREAADALYTEHVRAPLDRGDLWMARRKLVLPYLKPALGVLDEDAKPTRKARAELTRHLLRLATETYAGEPRLPPAVTRKGHARIAALTAASASGEPAAFARAMNALLCDPQLLPKWSVRLGDVDPARNTFRELRFSIV